MNPRGPLNQIPRLKGQFLWTQFAQARKAGATEQELAETTLVAAALRAGGPMTHGTHALE